MAIKENRQFRYHKNKNLCGSRAFMKKVKRQLMKCEKIFANNVSGKRFYQKLINNYFNSTTKRQSD